MAGDWIKMRTNLPTNPKVVTLSCALRAHVREIVGACFIVWAIADTHSTDGKLPGYTAEVLDNAVGLPGFMAQMAAVKWAEITPEGVVLKEFSKHNGRTAKRRADSAQRASRYRDNPVRKTSREAVTKCAPTEEKRREEKQQQQHIAVVAVGLSPEQVQTRAAYIARKPDWLPDGLGWIDPQQAAELADTRLTQADVDSVVKAVYRTRKTLKNPAGLAVQKLRTLAKNRAEQAKETTE